jgi:hypothetical protein
VNGIAIASVQRQLGQYFAFVLKVIYRKVIYLKWIYL